VARNSRFTAASCIPAPRSKDTANARAIAESASPIGCEVINAAKSACTRCSIGPISDTTPPRAPVGPKPEAGCPSRARLPHVSEQYLGKRAEFRGKRTLCDDVTPVYSTGKDSLDLLATFTDVAKPLRTLAQLDKDNGTYYLTTEYNKDGSIKKQKGMLQFVDDSSIIHHSLNGVSTITTRLSSARPNLHNLPRDGTSKVKQMFTSRFGTDGCIVEVDYTARVQWSAR